MRFGLRRFILLKWMKCETPNYTSNWSWSGKQEWRALTTLRILFEHKTMLTNWMKTMNWWINQFEQMFLYKLSHFKMKSKFSDVALIWGAFEIWYAITMTVEKYTLKCMTFIYTCFWTSFTEEEKIRGAKKKKYEYNCSNAMKSYAVTFARRRKKKYYDAKLYVYHIIFYFVYSYNRIDINTSDFLIWLKLN